MEKIRYSLRNITSTSVPVRTQCFDDQDFETLGIYRPARCVNPNQIDGLFVWYMREANGKREDRVLPWNPKYSLLCSARFWQAYEIPFSLVIMCSGGQVDAYAQHLETSWEGSQHHRPRIHVISTPHQLI